MMDTIIKFGGWKYHSQYSTIQHMSDKQLLRAGGLRFPNNQSIQGSD